MTLRKLFNASLVIFCFMGALGHMSGSELRFLSPGFDEKTLLPVEQEEIGVIATKALVSTLNELLRTNDKSVASYRRLFGVEQTGSLDEMGSKGISAYLNYLFTSLSVDGRSASDAKLEYIRYGSVLQLSKTGDYTSFGATIRVQGSRYETAFLTFALELEDWPELPGVKVASIKPGKIYFSLK